MASAFASAGLTEVLLPSGFRVRGVIPGLTVLAQRGLLDDRVAAAAQRLADKAWLKDAEPSAFERDLRTYVDALVAGFAREALDPGAAEWAPTNLGVADLPNIDQRDRDLLEELVMHRKTADEVTALAQAAIDAVAVQEVPDELDRLVDFRDEPGSAARGEDGAGVLDPALVAAADGG